MAESTPLLMLPAKAPACKLVALLPPAAHLGSLTALLSPVLALRLSDAVAAHR